MAHKFVSYHKVVDILKRPFQDPRLKGISLRPELASLLPSPSSRRLPRLHQAAKVALGTAEKRREKTKMTIMQESDDGDWEICYSIQH